MKSAPILLLLCLSGLLSFSQHTKVNLSNEFKIKEKEYKDQVLANSVFIRNKIITVTNSGASGGKWLFTKLYDIRVSVTLASFDRNMNPLKEVELEGGDRNFGPLFPDLVLLGDRLILAYFKKDDKESFSLYLSMVNQDDLSISKPAKVATVMQENVGVFKIMSVIEAGLFHFSVSPDQSLLLVTSKNSTQKIENVLFDKDLKELKRTVSQISLPDYYISSPMITNDRKAIVKVSSGKEVRIVAWDADGKKTENKLAGTGSQSYTNSSMRIAKDGQKVYISGSIVDGTVESDPPCTGFFITQLDLASLKLTKVRNYTFSPDFIMKSIDRGAGIKTRRDVRMFDFTPSLVEMEGEDIAIVASPEDISVSSSTRSSYNSRTGGWSSREVATTTLTVGPVMVFYPDKEGKNFEPVFINRKIILSKSQSSGSGAIQIVQAPNLKTSPSGYIAQFKNGELIILYTDNTDNLTKGSETKIIPSKNPIDLAICEAVVGKDHKASPGKLVHDIHQNNLTYFISNPIPNPEGQLIFPIGKDAGLKTIFQFIAYVEVN